MISKSYDIILENWLFYIFIVVAQTVFIGLSDVGQKGQIAMNLVAAPAGLLATGLSILLALFVYRTALYGLSFGARPDGMRLGQDFFRLAVKAAILFAIALVPSGVFFAWMKHSGVILHPQVPTLKLIVPSSVIAALSSSVVFSYAGTWLPASVYGDNTSFSVALKRGDKGFLPIFVRLAPIALLTSGLAVALSYGAASWGVSISVESWSHVLIGGAIKCLEMATGAFYITFAAVILSHYYLTSENADAGGSSPLARSV